MNKLIENLMLEATKDMPQGYYIPGEYFQKFAELILKASFDVVINDGRFHDAKGIIRAAKYTAMEHFGVEE